MVPLVIRQALPVRQDKNEVGAAGPTGSLAPSGPSGSAGSKGQKGEVGSTGPQVLLVIQVPLARQALQVTMGLTVVKDKKVK